MKTGYHPMTPEIGYKPMQTLLSKTHAFTAIFCFNDISAIGAIRALKDAGLTCRETFRWWASTIFSRLSMQRHR